MLSFALPNDKMGNLQTLIGHIVDYRKQFEKMKARAIRDFLKREYGTYYTLDDINLARQLLEKQAKKSKQTMSRDGVSKKSKEIKKRDKKKKGSKKKE